MQKTHFERKGMQKDPHGFRRTRGRLRAAGWEISKRKKYLGQDKYEEQLLYRCVSAINVCQNY